MVYWANIILYSAVLERNGESSVNELRLLNNILPLLLHASDALFLSILYISRIRTESQILSFLSPLFSPLNQAQLSKAQEEMGTVKLQLQTVSIYVLFRQYTVCAQGNISSTSFY